MKKKRLLGNETAQLLLQLPANSSQWLTNISQEDWQLNQGMNHLAASRVTGLKKEKSWKVNL